MRSLLRKPTLVSPSFFSISASSLRICCSSAIAVEKSGSSGTAAADAAGAAGAEAGAAAGIGLGMISRASEPFSMLGIRRERTLSISFFFMWSGKEEGFMTRTEDLTG